ncbi:YegP family protein [Devosia sp. Root436]|uniref:YegP family protein n=1 Tax=Devosia sp. Root436 TaxID=1736537 RepID=UPI00244E6385|nr:YegP family protein [Devosia sp. Root436]
MVASKDGQHFVRFVAGNGETMVRTETYTSKASARNAIESLQTRGPDAPVSDEA